MLRLVRILGWVVIGLVVLAAAALGLAWWLASRSLPDYDATREVTGLHGPVEIVRDRHAVPHIFAEDARDVFFGLGYAHAQDRLWQMTMLRRTAQGRLSELFGARTATIDEFIRRLDIYGAAQAAVPHQDPEVRAALEAYAAGVNARLAELAEGGHGRGAPEFFLFGQAIAPWRPADSLAVIKLMALKLAGHMDAEIQLARLSALLDDPARIRDIMGVEPGPALTELGYLELFPGLERRQALAPRPPRDPLMPSPPWDLAGASNAWAAAPARTAKRASLLASDPHLGLSAPSIWYLARLEFPEGGVIGGTIPGLPAVLVGRNRRIAWGLTSAYVDDQDLVVEKLDPDDPGRYIGPDGPAPLRRRTESIAVKGEAPRSITLSWTANGPVLPGKLFGLGALTPPGHVMALRWTALDPDDRSMTAAMHLMRAGSVAEAIAAGRDFKAPAQNLTVVDREHIALVTIGAIPRRDPAHQTRGRMPAPGWVARNLWQGYFPYEENPRFVDPPSGLVGNTNNKVIDRPFPADVSWRWGDTQRIRRLRELMARRPVHTRESFIAAQLDTVSFTARALLPLMLRSLPEPGPDADPRRAEVVKMLGAWTGEMDEHRPEPLIYHVWLWTLFHALADDELGPLAAEFPRADPVFVERVLRDVEGAAAWCDDRRTPEAESCAQVTARALDAALARI
ncbi:MAG: penicillin acylase family protein, partial [Alphaproteobacteria bacterium]